MIILKWIISYDIDTKNYKYISESISGYISDTDTKFINIFGNYYNTIINVVKKLKIIIDELQKHEHEIYITKIIDYFCKSINKDNKDNIYDNDNNKKSGIIIQMI